MSFVAGDAPDSVALGNFNGDTDLDIAVADFETPSVSVLLNFCPALAVDMKGTAEAATDIVYVARSLLGLPAVPSKFRTLDPSIPPNAQIEFHVEGLMSALDVDANGFTDVATDLTYITRHLLGLPPVPASFRLLDPSIPPDAEIIDRIEPLI